MIRNASFLGAVPIRQGGYRPLYASRPRLGQGPFVEVRPDITIESPKIAPTLNIELGGLPLSLGLFAGSALAFYLRRQLPSGLPQTAALVGGAVLAAGGIINLLLPKARAEEAKPAAAPQAVPGAPSPVQLPAPVVPGGAGPAGPQSYSASNAQAFENVTGRIVMPADFATVDVPFYRSSYPVRVQLLNSSQAPVTFELELIAEEEPHPVGSPVISTLPAQVSLGPGQVKDVDVTMPIADWGSLVDYSDVILTARKRRIPGEEAQLIDSRSFVLE